MQVVGPEYSMGVDVNMNMNVWDGAGGHSRSLGKEAPPPVGRQRRTVRQHAVLHGTTSLSQAEA